MTRRIITTQHVSLDGVIEDPAGREGSGLGDWTGTFSPGGRGDAFKHEELMSADTLLFGRKTYEGFAAVWPRVDDAAGYAARMNALPKYVVSWTLTAAEWSNTTIIDDDLVGDVRELKAAPGGDILIFGSASVVWALTARGLIDEYRLLTYPVVLGRGLRLFAEGDATTLRLVDCHSFDDGIVLSRYERAMSRTVEIAAQIRTHPRGV